MYPKYVPIVIREGYICKGVMDIYDILQYFIKKDGNSNNDI